MKTKKKPDPDLSDRLRPCPPGLWYDVYPFSDELLHLEAVAMTVAANTRSPRKRRAAWTSNIGPRLDAIFGPAAVGPLAWEQAHHSCREYLRHGILNID